MTETQRQNLLMACSFAKVFIEAADAEIRAMSGRDCWPGAYTREMVDARSASRYEAHDQLTAALDQLDDVYNPDINRPSTQPYPQHIDSDRHRGPTDWDRECQESRRLNR